VNLRAILEARKVYL